MSEDVLAREGQHLDLAWRCLAAMRAQTEAMPDMGVDELASIGLARMRARRLASLAADPGTPPFFARIDTDGHETFHLGRRHVRDDDGEPVVIDWRVPIARTFYQATAGERMGLRLRRRFGFHEGALTSFEDEHLDQGESLGLASDLLREEIERPRVGPMRDIVATIQPDQDDLVRADFDHSLCIQGAPGTGKTAVGLHRAAYLLYTYPERLRRSGVLVVGPNAAFLHYVAEVLPTLGEVGVAQSTVDNLVSADGTATDEDAGVATLKGDPRMTTVLHRAVRSHVRKPLADLQIQHGTARHRVPVSRLRRYVDDIRRSGVRWSLGRERLHHQIAADVRRQMEDAGGAPSDSATAAVARSASVRGFVNEVWPAVTPETLLLRLYADAGFRRASAGDVLTEDELAALAWAKPPRSPRSARWTVADLVLLDELRHAIDGVPTFDHIIVDEAQDLSAMQCRAVGRRCPLGSVTVLGDLAQATTPWAPGSWQETLRHLGHEEAEVRPLTAGYRVPQAILDLANRLLPHIAAEVPPATSVRSGVHPLAYAALGALVDAVRQASTNDGSVGVIAPATLVADVLGRLRGAGVPAELLDVDEDHRITVLPATEAKGLEFDSVVLVEPAAIVASEARRADGLRRLYVTMTRAVSHMVIVHGQPLPAELT
ncbi:MAG: AAA family ATPase [Actinomycetota bacterium]|nr:AAA family ATPase [Actinomycetota bacterium]